MDDLNLEKKNLYQSRVRQQVLADHSNE